MEMDPAFPGGRASARTEGCRERGRPLRRGQGAAGPQWRKRRGPGARGSQGQSCLSARPPWHPQGWRETLPFPDLAKPSPAGRAGAGEAGGGRVRGCSSAAFPLVRGPLTPDPRARRRALAAPASPSCPQSLLFRAVCASSSGSPLRPCFSHASGPHPCPNGSFGAGWQGLRLCPAPCRSEQQE